MPADHYQTLGVTSNADIAQIKRRYRQLVRQHHPDALPVAQRESAHAQMLAINQAWTTLSDPASRARYDRTQNTAPSFVIHPPQSSTTNFSATSTRNVSAAQTTSSQDNSSQTARTATSARAASTAKTATKTTAKTTVKTANRRTGDTRSRLLTQVFEAAELYFFYGKAGEAIGLCRRVLSQDPNNAEAHALLGDIYADQGRFDVAVFMFERAVQSQPQNTLYRQKWQALSSKVNGFSPTDFQSARFSEHEFPHADFVEHDANGLGQARRTTANSSTRSNEPRSDETRNDESSSALENDAVRVISGAALAVLSTLLVLSGHFSAMGGTFQWSPAAPIAGRLLISGVLSAFMLGAALPLLKWIEPFGAIAKRHSPVEGTPTSLLVGLAGIAFAPLGWAFALLLSLSTRRTNTPLFSCLAIAILLSATLSFPARGTSSVPSLSDALLWWSGRAVFPALLAGWALGSLNAKDH